MRRLNMKVVDTLGIVVVASIVLTGCSGNPSGRAGGSPTAVRASSTSAGPVIKHRRLVRTFELDGGRIVVRPTAVRFPHVVNAETRAYHQTLARSLPVVESSDPLLWRNTGTIRTKARWVTAKAAYARISVSRRLRPDHTPGHDTLAWIVFYRIGLSSGCRTGWRLYVDALLPPTRPSGYKGEPYIVTTPVRSGCSGLTHARVRISFPHLSERWHLVRRTAEKATIRFAGECSPNPQALKVRRGNEEEILAVVDIGDVICPAAAEPRRVVLSVPEHVALVHGPTGYLPRHHIPLR